MSGLPSNPSKSVAKLNPHIYAGGGANFPVAKQSLVPSLVKPKASGASIKLNKLERAYLTYLQVLGVPCLNVQAITLKLADDCRLTVDFTYRDENGVFTFVDTKGFQREDALLKMKFAKQRFPEFRFVIVTKKSGGGWHNREIRL